MSLSQPTFFVSNCLPPLSPFPPNESSNSNSKNVPMEEIDVSSRGSTTDLSSPMENPFRGNNGHPPRRGHRRSNSDVPLGFSDMIQSSPQLVPISGHGVLDKGANITESSRTDNSIGIKRQGTGGVGIGQRKLEGEVVDELDPRHDTSYKGRVKRSAAGDVALPFRHCRSLSMDSGIGNFHFGDSSPNSRTSFRNLVDHPSPSNSLSNINSTNISSDLGHGEFSDAELKKIMGDERLAEIAISDPKQAKRILANRQSAARSKERKMRYIAELEHKVQTLQAETTILSAQITIQQKEHAELSNQNNELKFRIQAMEQQAQLRDALHETLSGEVQRLKLEDIESREEGRTSNGFVQMKHHMFPTMQHNKVQRLSVTTSKTSTT